MSGDRIDTRSSADALRNQAEEIAQARTDGPEGPVFFSAEAAQKLVHELQVHQIELELQNDELRRSQEALERARARYFDLYDLAPISYFTLSSRGLILEANLAGARMLGVARGALIQQPLSLFILPEDQDTYYLHCRQLEKTGAHQAFELRLARADGTPFWGWFEGTVADDNDGVRIWRIVVSNITERKATDQALRTADAMRESWMRFRLLAESLPQLVWTSRADGLFDYLSPQWAAYTGAPEEEQLGLGWLKQLHPDDRHHTVVAWNKAVGEGTTFDAEFRIRRYDGTYRRFRSRATALPVGAGGGTKWFGTNTDVHESVGSAASHA